MSGVCLVGADAPGGVRTYARIVTAGLERRFPDRRIHRLDGRGPSALLSPLWCVAAALRLAALAAAGRCDTVHLLVTERLSLTRKGLLAAWARLLGLRVVMHHHGAEFPELSARRGPVGRIWETLMLAPPHLHLVLGEEWRAALLARRVAKERVVTLPNALPDRPPARRAEEDAPPRLLFLGELSARKGIATTLRAAAALRAGGTHFTLDVAGDGPDARSARKLAGRLGLLGPCGSVRFLGPLDPAAALARLETADLLIHPSRREGLPMVLLEALRAGTPALASPVGAIGEALPDGAGLLHVPPDDPDALAAAVADLAADPKARRRIGAAGRRLFEDRFRLERHVERLAEIYGWPTAGPSGGEARAAACADPRRREGRDHAAVA